jgi:hypothetical protein
LGHEIGHFAELFFFHGLTPFSFRVNRERQFPAADKAAPGAGEKREPSLRCILKNRNKPQPVRQENVGFFFSSAPPLARALSPRRELPKRSVQPNLYDFARDMGRTRSESRHAPLLRERFSTLDAGFDGLA